MNRCTSLIWALVLGSLSKFSKVIRVNYYKFRTGMSFIMPPLEIEKMHRIAIFMMKKKSCCTAAYYASSEFRHNYVTLWVLFRKWGMKGVCLRKRWGKYSKVLFIIIYRMNISRNNVHCWVSIWNKTYTEIYLKSRYN